jgi:hypothetical protein
MIGRFKSSFMVKALAAVALVVLGDRLFWAGQGVGSNLGWFAIAWAVAAAAVIPAVRHDRRALTAALAALVLAAIMADDPGFLALLMFGSALSCAVLLPRYARFDHAGRWAVRVAVHVVISVAGPWADLLRLSRKRRRRGGGVSVRGLLPLLPLPLIGGAIFLALFASANPVIGDALLRFGAPELSFEDVARFIFWGILFTAVWGMLRPRRVMVPFASDYYDPQLVLPGVSIGSVTLALITFNALFALQNGLDIAFLWSGAALPDGMTLADYAHRSAYPLIATALLAGLFVLVTLRPGSDTAAVPLIRRLVVLWIAQNVFLVASSILRTIDYIEVYSLTQLRIAALIWMALVAVGLVLIVWRMLAGKSGAWLINANVLAAGLVLTVCSVIDLGSVAAAWNVRHAREVGGKGAALDLCYLNRLGPSALVSLVELERQPGLDPDFARRVAWTRHWTLAHVLAAQQGGEWTWRNARRLGRIAAMQNGTPLAAPPPPGDNGRACDGTLRPAPPAIVEAPDETAADAADTVDAPLTNEAQR